MDHSEIRFPKCLKRSASVHLDQLIDETVPASIRMKLPLDLPEGMNEYQYLNHLKIIGSKNKIFKTLIGLGYYNTITPGVILTEHS